MSDASHPDYPWNVAETLDQLVARIEPFVPQEVDASSDRVTGALTELSSWWQQRASGALKALEIQSPVVTNMAEGIATANAAIDSGHNLLFLTADSTPNSTPESHLVRALIGILTRKDAYSVFFQGTNQQSASDRAAMVSMAEIRDLMREHLEARGEPLRLSALDPQIDFVVGLLLASSARKTPVITGTNDHLVGALIAQRLCMKASSWWRHGSTSPDPATLAAVDRMGIPPGLPLDLSDQLGVGAHVSVMLLREIVKN